MKPVVKWAVVTDFDGTISMKDVSDEICFHFKTASRAAIRRSYAPGVRVEDWVSASFGAITAPRAEVEKFIFGFVSPREGLAGFLNYCRRGAVPVEVASGGLDIYIAPLLQKWNMADVPFFCARVSEKKPAGYAVSYARLLKQAATVDDFKTLRVQRLQKLGYKVLFCGDGTSDFSAARQADAVFARYRLAGLCARNGVKFKRLGGFGAVEKFLKEHSNAS